MNKKTVENQLVRDQKSAIDRIFSTRDGKLFLSWLGNAVFGGVGKVFHNSVSDAYWRGRESVLLDILGIMKISPSEYYGMLNNMMEEGENYDLG